MLRIVMDGAGDLPREWIKEYQIDVIPINIHFGEQAYLQGIDLSNDGFYELAEQGSGIPQTSQPSPAQFIEFYRRIAQKGDTILSVHVTSKLSGTFESALLAARQLAEEFVIVPFDSASGSAAMGYMCREARLLARQGAPLEKIRTRLDFISRQVEIILTLDRLEYARRSGRVKALQAALASLLDVKPVVVLRHGILHMADRVRTRHRALEHVVETMRQRMEGRPVNVAVVHARDPQAAEWLAERVSQALPVCELIRTDLSIAVAANLGPGTVGVIAYPVEEG